MRRGEVCLTCILVVHVCTFLQQKLHHDHVPSVAGFRERRPTRSCRVDRNRQNRQTFKGRFGHCAPLEVTSLTPTPASNNARTASMLPLPIAIFMGEAPSANSQRARLSHLDTIAIYHAAKGPTKTSPTVLALGLAPLSRIPVIASASPFLQAWCRGWPSSNKLFQCLFGANTAAAVAVAGSGFSSARDTVGLRRTEIQDSVPTSIRCSLKQAHWLQVAMKLQLPKLNAQDAMPCPHQLQTCRPASTSPR